MRCAKAARQSKERRHLKMAIARNWCLMPREDRMRVDAGLVSADEVSTGSGSDRVIRSHLESLCELRPGRYRSRY